MKNVQGEKEMTTNTILIFAFVLLCASAVQAQEDFCSQTADFLLTGCKAQANADADIKNAICLNYSDESTRDECLSERKDDLSEARQLCEDQHAWRLEGCNSTGQNRYDPDPDPSNFDSDFKNLTKPNPYFPLTIGNIWKYKGGGETNIVEILDATKNIEGLTAIVVLDRVFEDGSLTEWTNDWFAQALNGDVWYLGEDTREYETFEGDHPKKPELIDNEGSFKFGRDDDKPGIIFLAKPKKGKSYFEEFSLANAEDITEILSTSYSFGKNSDLDQMVPQQLADRFCSGSECVVTKNFSLLEPSVIERKYYARGIGVFLEVELTAGQISQLVDCNFDSRCKNLPQP